MQDKFYVGGDLGKRDVKTPYPFNNQNSPYSNSITRNIIKSSFADVTKVYNPKIEQKPIHF